MLGSYLLDMNGLFFRGEVRGVWVLCVLFCLPVGGDAALSTEQQQTLLDKHNSLRSAEGASNMRYMVSICRKTTLYIYTYIYHCFLLTYCIRLTFDRSCASVASLIL